MKKRYLLKIISYNTRYVFYTLDEIYEKVFWLHDSIRFDGGNIGSTICKESIFLDNIHDPIKLMLLFENVESIKSLTY